MDTDVIVGRAAFPIRCSARTIYRMFKRGYLILLTYR